MVYTNLVSEVHVKSLINCPPSLYIGSDYITDDVNIVTAVTNFKESGFNKTVKTQRVFGDSVVTSITRPTQINLDLQLLVEDGVGSDLSVPTLLSRFNDLEEVGSYSTYTESDPKRRHRIALTWSDGTSEYMKVYYNAYVQAVSMTNDKRMEINLNCVVPILDIQTGSANYYEYEGTNGSDVLESLDASMEWS